MDAFKDLDVPFTFARRPVPLHPYLRPVWRIVLIVLIVRLAGRNDRTSLRRVRVADWLLINRDLLLALTEGTLSPTLKVVRLDPGLDRAIRFGAGEGFWTLPSGGHIVLSAAGKALADELESTDEVLAEERGLLAEISAFLTEEFVKSLLLSDAV